MAEDDFDDIMTDADFESALNELENAETNEITELLKLMNEHQIISWEEAERIIGDTSDEPIKSSLPPQTRPTEPDNDTNVNDTIQKLLNNDPKLTQINLNNMKRTPIPQIRRIIEAIRDNKHIEKLCLANMGLYDHDVSNLIDVIQENESLKSVNLETNYLGGDFFSNFFQAALVKETLEEVKCVNQGVNFATDKEKEIIKAIQKNQGLLKVSINLRLPEGRHKIENALIRNQDIRRELRRRQRLAEQETAAKNPPPPEPKQEKPKGIAPYIPGGDNPGPPKKKIIQVPEPPPPKKEPPPPRKLISEIPKPRDISPPPKEPLKVYRRTSVISQSDQNESPTSSKVNSPVKKTAKEAAEDRFAVKSEEKKPIGVYPRSKIAGVSQPTTDDERKVDSAMSNRTEDSESEREPQKDGLKPAPGVGATSSDAEKSGVEGDKPKKKIVKKKIVVKKVVKKKKPVAKVDGEAAKASESEDHADSGVVNHNHLDDESDHVEETKPEPVPPKRVPPPVLPKTTRPTEYSAYTPSSNGTRYGSSGFGGYSNRY